MRSAAAVVLIGLVLSPRPAAAAEVTVADLLADPGAYAASEITLTGELVGDFQRRGEAVWTQLNDDAYVTAPLHAGGSLSGTNLGVAVVLPTGMFDAAGFGQPGGYRVRGPVVRVTGIWRFHDEARAGESFLSATSLEIVAREQAISEGGNWTVLLIGVALVAVGLLLPLLRRRRTPGAE